VRSADNGFNLGWCKGWALDLGADGIEAFGGGRGTYRDQAAGRLGEAPERRLGEADFIGADQRVFVRDQQRCQQDSRVAPQLDPAKSAKDIGP
jgi:hypothetical protein